MRYLGSWHRQGKPEEVADDRGNGQENGTPGPIPPLRVPIFYVEHGQHHSFDGADLTLFRESGRIEPRVGATLRAEFGPAS